MAVVVSASAFCDPSLVALQRRGQIMAGFSKTTRRHVGAIGLGRYHHSTAHVLLPTGYPRTQLQSDLRLTWLLGTLAYPTYPAGGLLQV